MGQNEDFLEEFYVEIFNRFSYVRSYCEPSARADRLACLLTLLATRQEVSKKRARTVPPGPPFPCHAARIKTRFDSASAVGASREANTRGRREKQELGFLVG